MKLPLVDLSVQRPVFAVMLIGALVVLGLVSMPRLGVGLFPDVDVPLVTVTTRLPGATPDAVERAVTQPLEEALGVIGGVDGLFSSSSEGVSRILVRFELEQDVAVKAQDVRDKVAAARGSLPREADPPVVERFDAESDPILSILISGPLPIRSLSELADKQIKQRLQTVAGVGNVTLVGDRKREIRIWVDPLLLAGHGLAVDDVLGVLEREHIDVPGGRIETSETEYVVKTRAKLGTTEHFAALVMAQRGGRSIHLRDVAQVEDGMAEERTLARLNGERGVALRIRRQSGANQVAVAEAVKAELDRIRPELPANVSMVVAQDTTVYIQRSLAEVRSNLVLGGLLAVLVIFAFLRSWRSTLIVALAIPSSLAASFVFFYVCGFTLNNLTLIALSLSIGMLIDDAIVVVENIYRHVELGEEPEEAALRGTHEIGLAVVATTAALCAVFVPIAFMSGIVGRFFTEFGLVVTFAVCTSTLVALTLTPMLCSRVLGHRGRVGGGRVASAAVERGYGALERGYRRGLAWSLAHRPAVMAAAVAAVLAGVGLASVVPVDFAPASDRGEFNVWIKLPPGSPVHSTVAASVELERRFLAHPEVRAVFTTVGGGVDERVDQAEFYVQLTRSREREVSQNEIMEAFRTSIRAAPSTLTEFSVEHIPWMSVSGSRYYALTWALQGPDPARLEIYAQQLATRMEATGIFNDLGTSYEAYKPEIALRLNRERAADLGVSAAQIGRSISALLGGFAVASFEEGGERYDVRVQLRPEYRDDPAELGLLNVRARSGELIQLANLAEPQIGSGPVRIERRNRARTVTLHGNLAPGAPLGEASAAAQRFIAELNLSPGYSIESTGQTENMNETVDAMLFALGLALLATYMILAAQFNSFVHPLTIMLCAPLSLIGAFAALAIAGKTLEMMTQIGFLMLMGLVMKNGILLVDYTNQLRERGLTLREAVLEAAPTRLRPVLMTTFSTVFGMIPLATTGGEGAEFRGAMGIIVIGGMLASMFLTLLIVPVAYTLMDAAQTRLLRALLWVRDRVATLSLPYPGRGVAPRR